MKEFSWKIYFYEKERHLRIRNNLSYRSVIEMEQTRIEELKPDIDIFLKNTYSHSEDKNFFKRSIYKIIEEIDTTIKGFCKYHTADSL